VCPGFKFFKADRLYDVHMAAGQEALKEGVKE